MRSSIVSGVLAACLALPACRSAGNDEAAVAAVLESFYGAMKAAAPGRVMELIAPEAVFLESGRIETRRQYEESHLPADIRFESQVAGKREILHTTVEGDTAWIVASTDYDGEFDGAPVNFTSVQLMVLSRRDGGWKIRTVHWSSRRR
jgi:ketosteroid isomerase-like protein